jgi:hypothetical protein
MSLPIPDGPPLAVQQAQAAAATFPQAPVDPTAVLLLADQTIDLNAILDQAGASAIAGGGTFNVGTISTPHFPPFCGFKLPFLLFGFSFNVPEFDFPPKLPVFRLSIGINCLLSNPVNISAGVAYGGGRVSTSDPDPDLALDQAS